MKKIVKTFPAPTSIKRIGGKRVYIDTKKIIEASGMTPTELAEVLGISPFTLYRWSIKGIGRVGKLLLLAKKMGILEKVITDKPKYFRK